MTGPLTVEFITSVRQAIDSWGGPATATELARALDCEYGDAKSALDRLADMAAVCRRKDAAGVVFFWTPIDAVAEGGAA